jgi:hypothetical protein
MISRIRLATDCFAPCKTKILLCEPREVSLFIVLPVNQKSLGLPLGDSPEVAVARASTALKFKYSVLSEWGSCQGFKECDSGLLICVLSSNGRED